MVGVARLELAASWSRTMRATGCATPRKPIHYNEGTRNCQEKVDGQGGKVEGIGEESPESREEGKRNKGKKGEKRRKTGGKERDWA